MSRVRVLIVDDSAVTRLYLREMLSSDPDIEVVGAANGPLAAREMIKKLDPDVLTLDIEMPAMDGLEFLSRIMQLRPLPVIMFSGLTQEGSDAAMQALAIGAFDFVAKPAASYGDWIGAVDRLIGRIKAAANANVRPLKVLPRVVKPVVRDVRPWTGGRVIAIGASTGGVRALRSILGDLPADCAPILIAQHMPGAFVRSFAGRLDAMARISVVEVRDAMPVRGGHAYVASGDHDLIVERDGDGYLCRAVASSGREGCTPSVDVLFNSLAASAGRDGVGIVLTGMGRDGAQGCIAISEAGGITLAQDEDSSLIYGMPRAAYETGILDGEISLDDVAKYICGSLQARRGVFSNGARAR